MEPTKDRITPEQFYSESKWPEMKDKFDKSAFLFHYYDLCQFANDYAQQELQAYRDIIKELIPYMEQYTAQMAFFMDIPGRIEEVHKMKAIIDEGKKLIDTVTPT